MQNKREQFKKIKNFSLFYGMNKAEELSKYNMVIVEPEGQKVENIDLMHSKGTLVIAYVSIIEINENSPNFKFLKADDFLMVDEKILRNDKFNNYMINLNSKKWASILLHHISNLVLNYNYDGILLDTIGDIEFSVLDGNIKRQQIEGAVEILKNIRSIYQDIIIIQNNGLNEVIDNTYEYIDGVCWENPRFMDSSSSSWLNNITNKLCKLSEREKIKVLFLYEIKSLVPLLANANENINVKAEKYVITKEKYSKITSTITKEEKNSKVEDATITRAEKIAEENHFLIYVSEEYTNINDSS